MVSLFVIIALGAAFVISIAGKLNRWLSDAISGLSCAALAACALFAYKVLSASRYTPLVYKIGSWMPPVGIVMVVDAFSLLMLCVVNIIALISIVYSFSYMEHYTDKPKYYTLFMLMVAGMNGVIVSGDIFNLYVFLEIAAIASYALVAFGTEQEELEASFRYMVLGSVTSLFILLAIGIAYSYASTLNMADLSQVFASNPNPAIINFLTVLLVVGFGLKAAIVPFHAWLPDAHPSAPAPISAMLSGVLVKALGVYALIRLLANVVGADVGHVLVVLGCISMPVGGVLALYQKDIKRMLAYSTVSQIGYIIFAFGLGTPLGVLAALLHMINHAVGKSLLFLNSGAIVYATGERNLDKLGGLRQRMPVTAGTSLIASMSIAGIPPIGGFWSKLLIIVAGIQAKAYTATSIGVIVGIITLGYYLKLQRQAFFGEKNPQYVNVKEAPATMQAAMVALAVLSLLGGILLFPQIRAVVLDPAVEAIRSGVEYGTAVMGSVQ